MIIKLMLCASALIVNLRAEKVAPITNKFRADYSSDYAFSYDPFSEDALTYEKLKDLINGQNIRSVEGVLESFSKDSHNRRFLEGFLQIYDSRSAQAEGVSQKYPRTVLFNDGLILAFTGNPNVPSTYRSLEVIEFSKKDMDWKFHRIQFPSKHEPAQYTDHPKECASCHGSRPAPIWETYKLWPGAYGSDADNFIYADNELKHFKEYLKDRGQHPRYKFLKYPKSMIEKPGDGSNEGKPLAQFSTYLNLLNFKRIMNYLKKSPNFEQYKYAYAAALLCPDAWSYLPPEVRKKHEQRLGKDFQKVYDNTQGTLENSYEERIQRFNNLNAHSKGFTGQGGLSDTQERHGVKYIASLRFMVEGAGIQMSGWSMAHSPGEESYGFRHGIGDVYDSLLELLPELADSDTEFNKPEIRDPKSRGKGYAGYLAEKYCPILKRKSLAALSVLETTVKQDTLQKSKSH